MTIHKFLIDLNYSLNTDTSVAPAIVDGVCHRVFTEAPIKVHIPRKSQNWDIVWVRTVSPQEHAWYCLISPRFQGMLADMKATGYLLRDTNDVARLPTEEFFAI